MSLPTIDFLKLQLKLKGIHQTRRLGQHFLIDEQLLGRIADDVQAGPDSHVVEIGAGPGYLTTNLAARAGAVTAIELDERLKPIHADAFGTALSVQFVYGDAMRINLVEIARERAAELNLTRMQLTGNLPFQITSPLLFDQCGPGLPWSRMVFMVQREVADRIVSPPGRKDYGVLSVKLAMWWRASRLMEVPARRFSPPPEVDATVVSFEPVAAEEQPTAEEWPGLSKFIDAAFNQRRKKMVNSLAARLGVPGMKELATAALEKIGHDENTRAEMLRPEEFRRMFRILRES
ncbi:MAG: 16S rRNA (adenine(1518)-N(6)/adenine(1519)-N(6))-dimethyltransferase RsmA [Candidatus Sumerlaeia bacterium]